MHQGNSRPHSPPGFLRLGCPLLPLFNVEVEATSPHFFAFGFCFLFAFCLVVWCSVKLSSFHWLFFGFWISVLGLEIGPCLFTNGAAEIVALIQSLPQLATCTTSSGNDGKFCQNSDQSTKEAVCRPSLDHQHSEHRAPGLMPGSSPMASSRSREAPHKSTRLRQRRPDLRAETPTGGDP